MEQEKRQKEITRHGLIRVGLWLGGGWLLLVLCAWGILPDREVPGILWIGPRNWPSCGGRRGGRAGDAARRSPPERTGGRQRRRSWRPPL